MRKHNHLGFSITEALIASGILAIVVSGVMTMVGGNSVSDVFKGRIQSTNACLAEANRILGNFKQKGLIRSRFNMPIAPGYTPLSASTSPATPLTVTSATGAYVTSVESGILTADRWKSTLPIYGTPVSGVYDLRPHELIMGYMNAVQAIYNSDKSNFCPSSTTNPGKSSYNDGTLLGAVSSTSGLTSPVSYLKIQPFDTATGIPRPCSGESSPIDIRPPRPASPAIGVVASAITALDPTPLITTAGAGKNHPSSGVSVFSVPTTNAPVDNRGWVVTITIQHLDRSGQTRECSVQEKFQYSLQPLSTYTLEFEDVDSATNATTGDSTDPEAINNTLSLSGVTLNAGMTSTGGTGPTYPITGGANPSSPTSYAPTNTMFYGCGAPASGAGSYEQSINLRLKGVRAGSIMMCRNLSRLRPQPTAVTGGTRMVVDAAATGNGQRTMFYSTELMQNKYFNDAEAVGGIMGDTQIAGLYYPAGDYYCLTADGCGDATRDALPRFPWGYDGRSPSDPGVGAAVLTKVDGTAGLETYAYTPLTNNTYSAAPTAAPYSQTEPGWVPCETVDVCYDGVTHHAPDSSTSKTGFQKGSTPNNDAYHLTFTGLPVGCEVNIQMAEVDGGYNIKSTIFREYIHEKIPGNKLCRAGVSGGGNDYISGHVNYSWFFACKTPSSSPDPTVITSGPNVGSIARDCSDGAAPSLYPPSSANIMIPCCVDFPFYPAYRATNTP